MEIEIPLKARLRAAQAQTETGRTQSTESTPASGSGRVGEAVGEAVVETLPNSDKILLRMGELELIARNTANLRSGQTVLIELLESKTAAGEVLLRVLSEPLGDPKQAGEAAKMKAAVAGTSRLGPVMLKLLETLDNLPAMSGSNLDRATKGAVAALRANLIQPGADSIDKLQSLWTKLGLDLEAQLAKAAAEPQRLATDRAQDLKQQLKPLLQALAVHLKEVAQKAAVQAQPPTPQEPASTDLTERLIRTLTGLLPKPEPEVPGRLKSLILKAAGQPKPVSTEDSPVPAKDLARLKAGFIRDVLRLGERAKGGEKAVRIDTRLLKSDLGRIVKTHWPQIAEALNANQPEQLKAAVAQLDRAVAQLLQRAGLDLQALTRAALGGTEETVRGLEAIQVLNATATESEAALVLPLPFGPESGFNSGRVHLYQPPKQPGREGEERPFRLVFLLDMTNLGPVRVDVSLAKKDLMINLYVAKAEAAEWINSRVESLVGNLSELGFNVRSAAARTVETAPPVEDLAPDPGAPPRQGLIDIKA